MKITIDITGMYYSIEVNIDENSTVYDAMLAAQGQRSPNGGVMSFDAVDSNGAQSNFVNLIAVEYDAASTPASRQSQHPREPGIYSYDDNRGFSAPQNPGDISHQLAWQFYILDAEKTPKNGKGGTRQIVPARISNAGPAGIDLADGDTIIWRLVAIFGLAEATMKKTNSYSFPAGSARELR